MTNFRENILTYDDAISALEDAEKLIDNLTAEVALLKTITTLYGETMKVVTAQLDKIGKKNKARRLTPEEILDLHFEDTFYEERICEENGRKWHELELAMVCKDREVVFGWHGFSAELEDLAENAKEDRVTYGDEGFSMKYRYWTNKPSEEDMEEASK